jgi:hypothetical protein
MADVKRPETVPKEGDAISPIFAIKKDTPFKTQQMPYQQQLTTSRTKSS